ncbi:MAG: alpha/beta fold hydrolase [Erysipelotrichaceae bacterium]|nr:alpha/beta fold hydrolase [Erysipelotrichaceae bacterium]
MLEKLKALLKPKHNETSTRKTPVIITVHGYGRRRKHEMDHFALWAKNDPIMKQFEVIQFDLYDLFDETDCDWQKWVSRAKLVINEQELAGKDIYLIGFSMGGVIASYLAATSGSVKKLILLAPAFQYINVDAITSVITKGATSIFGGSDSGSHDYEIEIPKPFYNAFTSVIKNLKAYIKNVNCPVLLLHGDEDEVISVKSSVYAYDRIPHENKKLIILHNGHHRLLMDQKVSQEVYRIITLFIHDQIVIDQGFPEAEDILKVYERQNRMQKKTSDA